MLMQPCGKNRLCSLEDYIILALALGSPGGIQPRLSDFAFYRLCLHMQQDAVHVC